MSNFFNSEVVKGEISEISKLQQNILVSTLKFPEYSVKEKLTHVSLLRNLLEKQKILYTRLSLSDDPDAKELMERMIHTARMMGLPIDVDIREMFSFLEERIKTMEKALDNPELI
jgi:ketol-acid reductoisomerase